MATGPYDSIREYLAALDATGNLVRIAEMDLDAYESTAFTYRAVEELGYWKAPAFLVEKVRIGGRLIDGPLLGNAYGPWTAEALCMGVPLEQIASQQEACYRRAVEAV